MLASTWRKGKSCALLVGLKTGTATVGISMEIPQKLKSKITFWPSNSTSGFLSKEM